MSFGVYDRPPTLRPSRRRAARRAARASRRARSTSRAAALAAVVLAVPLSARAAVVDSTFASVPQNLYWTNPGNWFGGVPNNNGSTTYFAHINQGYTNDVYLNADATIDGLIFTATPNPGGSVMGVAVDAATLTVQTEVFLGSSGELMLENNSAAAVSPTINLVGNQTIAGTGTIRFGVNNRTDFLSTIRPVNGTLTLGPNVTVTGGTGVLGDVNFGLVNQGRIGPVANSPALHATITGLNWVNAPTGVIDASQFSVITLGGSWTNNGTLSLSGSATLNLGGSFTLAGLGTLNRTGGTLNVIGTLDNTNATLHLTSATGSWQLAGGGTIKGGTITADAGVQFIGPQANAYQTGVLDGVTLNTPFTLYPTATLTVRHGLTLGAQAPLTISGGTSGGVSTLIFDGTQTLPSGDITFSQYSCTVRPSGGVLTLGPGVTIHALASLGTLGDVNEKFINQGLVSLPAQGGLTVTGNNWVNDSGGVIDAPAGGSLTLDGSWTNVGTINATGGTRLTLQGTWSNPGTITATNSSVTVGGAFTTAQVASISRTASLLYLSGTLDNTGASLQVSADAGPVSVSGTIQHGTIDSPDGSTLSVPYASTFDGVALNCNATVGQSLTVLNGLTCGPGGAVKLTAKQSSLYFPGSQSFGGTVILTAPTFVTNVVSPDAGTTLTLTPSAVIRVQAGQGDLGAVNNTLVNQGLISVEGFNSIGDIYGANWVNAAGGIIQAINFGRVYLNGTWSNLGTFHVDNGTIFLGGTLTPAMIGAVTRGPGGGTVAATGTLDITGTTLDMDGPNGPIGIAGGTIQGTGSIVGTAGTPLPTFGGTISASTVSTGIVAASEITLSKTTTLTISGGVALDSGLTIRLVSNASGFTNNVVMSGTRTLVGETVIFDGTASTGILSGTVLNFDPDTVVKSGTQGGTVGVNANQGLISAQTSGKTLTVTNAISVWSNTGTLEVINGGTLSLSGHWFNSGTLRVDHASLFLGGTFRWADISTMTRNAGTVFITGTFDGQNTTIDQDGPLGLFNFGTGAVVSNATFTASAGAVTTINGTACTFNNAALNTAVNLVGTLTLGTGGSIGAGAAISASPNSTLTVSGGSIGAGASITMGTNATLSLQSGGMIGSGSTVTMAGGAQLKVFGTQTLTGLTVTLNGGSISSTTSSFTVTLGPTTVIRGGTSTASTVGAALSNTWAIANQGLITSDTSGATLTVTGTNWSNAATGTLEALTGATLTTSGTWTNAGTIHVDHGTINLGGTINSPFTGTFTNTGGTINVSGTINVGTGKTLALTDTTGSLNLVGGGVISGGTLTTSGAAQLIVKGTSTLSSTLHGDVTVNAGGTLTYRGGSAADSRVHLSSGATAAVIYYTSSPNMTTFDGTSNLGRIEAGASGGAVQVSAGTTVRTGDRGGTIGRATPASTVSNRGSILATGAANSITIAGQFTNTDSGAVDAVDGGGIVVSSTLYSQSGGFTRASRGGVISGTTTLSIAAGRIGGNGTISAPISLTTNSGVLAPGNTEVAGASTVGTLTTGNLTFQPGAAEFELTTPGPDSAHPGAGDHVTVNGALGFSGQGGPAPLTILNAGGFGAGFYRLFDYTTVSNFKPNASVPGATPTGSFSIVDSSGLYCIVSDVGGGLVLHATTTVQPVHWIGGPGASFTSSSNWYGQQAPTGTAPTARVLEDGCATISLGSTQSVGSLVLTRSSDISLVGGHLLNFNAGAAPAVATITAGGGGAHSLQQPDLSSDLSVTVDPGTSLTLGKAGLISNAGGKTITMQGGGVLNLTGTQTHGNGAVLNVSAGTTNLQSDPGPTSDARYTLAVNVTPGAANGAAMVEIASHAGDQVHLRDLRVNAVGSGGAGLVVIDAALNGSSPNPQTGFGGVGGSVAVYIGDGAGNAGLASRATVENLWRSAALEGWWAQRNGLVASVTRGVTLASGVVSDPTMNGLVIEPSVDNAGKAVTYLGEDVQGDVNGDGKVDVNDVGVVLQHLNMPPGSVAGEGGYTLYTPGEGDVDGDLTVSVNDVTVVLAHLNQTYAPAASGSVGGTGAVPEPATIGVLAAMAGLMLRRRRGI